MRPRNQYRELGVTMRLQTGRMPSLALHLITRRLQLCEPTPFISSSCSFRYQLLHFLLTYFFTHHFFLFWFTTLSSTLGLKPTCFTNPTPHSFTPSSRAAFMDYCPDCFFLTYSVFVFSFLYFLSVPCDGLGWSSRQFLSACKHTVLYRIVICKVLSTSMTQLQYYYDKWSLLWQ